MSRHMTKPTKLPVRPAKTLISLGIRPVWSESLLSAWRNIGPLTTYWAHNEDSDQTGRICVFTGRTCHFVDFFVQRLIYAKTLKNLLLWNQKADDLESLFAASYTRMLLKQLFKWWLWVDLDLFYGKVKIWSSFLLYGIKLKLWIFQKLVIHWPWSKSLGFNISFPQ